MICPNCQTDNRDIAKFCKECGRYLAPTCPNCGSELPDAANFCDICGTQLSSSARVSRSVPRTSPSAASKQPLNLVRESDQESTPDNLSRELLATMRATQVSSDKAGERRVVTMLFCDVKGSTMAAEKLDPEEWAEIINEAFEYMISPIYRYDGTVARLMGDGILAFFGAPTAHEDDPVRAVLAGLEIIEGIDIYRQQIRERFQIDFNVRVGINTGRVVVGSVGSDRHHEYSALGDAINVAARMEQSAEPGTVLVAEDTYKIVKPVFDFENLGDLLVKGKEDPVQAFRVVGRRAEPDSIRGIAGREPPLVGREKEMQTLKEASKALGKGQGGILFLTGQAGLGKTRLLREIQTNWLADQSEPPASSPFSWTYITSASYEEREAYGVMKKEMRALCGIDDDANPVPIRARVSDLLNALSPEKQASASAVILTFLGVEEENDLEIEGEAYRRLLFSATWELLRSYASKEPIIMLIDNLHWSDPASAAFFSHLFQIVDVAPVLFVFAMRPDREAISWETKAKAESDYPHRYINLPLKPLVDEDCLTLTATILNTNALPDRLQSLILGSSEGNPYFIEEVIRTLLEERILTKDAESGKWQMATDVEATIVPNNLHALLSARIDGLDEDAQHVLQVASVAGSTFHYSTLQQILKLNGNLDGLLSMLQRREFIVQGASDPDRTYSFRSPLLQEIVYRSILRKLRSDFHLLVAETILEQYRDNIDEHTSELAHHFYQARDYRAIAFLSQSGDAAFKLYANAEAEEYYSQALEIALSNSNISVDQLSYLFQRRGRALELDSQFSEALSTYVNMEEVAIKRQDRPMEMAAILAQATIHTMASDQFDAQEAESLAKRALEMAQLEDDKVAEAKIYWILLDVFRFTNNLEQAREYGELSLNLARKYDLKEQMAYTANDISHAYMDLGALQKAYDSLVMASDLWRELDNKPMLADSLASATIVTGLMGRYDLANAQSADAFEISQAIENSWGKSFSRLFLGTVLWEQGDPGRAIEVLESSIQFGREADFIVAESYGGAQLAQIHAFLGDLELAEELAGKALQFSREKLPYYRQLPIIALGLVLLLRGNLADMAAIFEELDPFRELQIKSFWLELNYFLCFFLSATGDLEEAGKLTQYLLKTIEETNALMYLPRALCLRGDILQKMGRLEEAGKFLEEAQKAAESMGALWPLWQILALQAKVHDDLKNATRANSALSKARSILESIAERLPSSKMRNTFLASPYVHLYLPTPEDGLP